MGRLLVSRNRSQPFIVLAVTVMITTCHKSVRPDIIYTVFVYIHKYFAGRIIFESKRNHFFVITYIILDCLDGFKYIGPPRLGYITDIGSCGLIFSHEYIAFVLGTHMDGVLGERISCTCGHSSVFIFSTQAHTHLNSKGFISHIGSRTIIIISIDACGLPYIRCIGDLPGEIYLSQRRGITATYVRIKIRFSAIANTVIIIIGKGFASGIFFQLGLGSRFCRRTFIMIQVRHIPVGDNIHIGIIAA